VIDTASNMVVGAPIPVGTGPAGVAITPDGKYAYVANNGIVFPTPVPGTTVSVIDTTSNTVLTGPGFPITVGSFPNAVAVTPDGKYAYVANSGSNNVSVIATATNTVVATLAVGNGPIGVGIIPDVPFLAFSAQLQLDVNANPAKDALALETSFTLGMKAPAINPLTQAVTFQAGPYSATIPAGKFKQSGPLFTYAGTINGVNVQALITQTGTMRYAFAAAAEHPNLTNTTNPVRVRLTIGSDSGTKPVTALIFH
jgi:YVTN family beta-propeller protein